MVPSPHRHHRRLKIPGTNHDRVAYTDHVVNKDHELREEHVTQTDHIADTDDWLNSDSEANENDDQISYFVANTDDEPNSENIAHANDGQNSEYIANIDDGPKFNREAKTKRLAHALRDLKDHANQRARATTGSILDVTPESNEQNNIHDKAAEEKRTVTLLKKELVVEKAALLAKAINDYRTITTNGSHDDKDLSDTYNLTVSREYIKHFFSDVKPVQNISCKLLIDQDNVETGKAYMNMITKPRQQISSEDYLNMTRNCKTFIKQRHYLTTSFNNVEQNFPLAYSIVAYRHVEQIERLLRLVYRPQNFYCIHMDIKSSDVDLAAVRAITSCFPNVVMPATAVSVKWGQFSVLEAELVCLESLWRFPGWRYFINLTGQELPLKTNLELVKILQAMKGANLAGGSRNRVRYVNYRRYSYAGKPPHGIQVVKGPVHVAVNREFVDFVLHDNRSRDFLEWLKDTGVPDESFFSTLNHNTHLGIPGSFLGDPEEYPEKPMITRYKNWRWPNGNWNRPCAGKYVHQICIVGVADLHRLANTLGLFVNKVQLNYEHVTFDCLEEMIVNRTRDQYLNLQPLDLTVYERLDQVKLRLKDATGN